MLGIWGQKSGTVQGRTLLYQKWQNQQKFTSSTHWLGLQNHNGDLKIIVEIP